MEMIAGRNEPCPCGSGKKYKKCCMNKQQVIDINQAREERIAQQKHQLTKKLQAFMDKQITYNEFLKLQSEFHQRSKKLVPEQIEEGYVNFWLNFFQIHKNGLTGIDWFLKEEAYRLQADEKNLAEQWSTLKPRIVQAVNEENNQVVFLDVFTEETFKMAKDTENLPTFRPWYGTLGLVEFFGDTPLFNGIRIFQGPDHVDRSVEKVNQLATEHDIAVVDVLIQYFPEVLGSLLEKEQRPDLENQQSNALITFEAPVTDVQSFATLLRDKDEFVVYDWREEHKHLTQAENWAVYKDSIIESEVLMAEAVATLEFTNDSLKYITYKKEKAVQFRDLLNDYPQFVGDVKESTSGKLGSGMAFSNNLMQMTGEAPEYFPLYAQRAKDMDLDQPIPALGQNSIYQLIDHGQFEEADRWFKQIEFNLYDQVIAKYNDIDFTFDINPFRKDAGLSPSPFVTGQENRDSSIKPIYYHDNQFLSVKKEDINTYEDLGFSPDSIDAFYHDPILSFFKEKTDGKGANTVRKYRMSLFNIRYSLEVQKVKDWSDCTKEFWKKHLLIDLFEDVVISQTQVKDLLSTIKMFTKWLDQKHRTAIHTDASAVCAELEASLIEAVQVYNFTTDSGRFSLPQFQKEIDPEAVGGLYKIQDVKEDRVEVKSIDSKQSISITLPKKALSQVHSGLILEAVISQDDNNQPILKKLLNAYPKEAISYL
ncbi:YecA family protein [Alkalicoccobacillus plakortidis]|uniref:SEC-C domain-containing protein n=1 Tax=Alkalicoccobacillus plakortidis TaxID=444060 RepID=A0ABT0XMX4_9BACI|nr:SEC-C domain-containing protein [Alkalicoccobacillus plakortidis]MCM2677255.1 SEC-C domain-containing protein [Alkalicoccobacillus plakortidis]